MVFHLGHFSFGAASIFFYHLVLRLFSFAIPGHSDGWDGNGMKRRGKMRPDTNTAPEMGEGKSVETPFLGVYSWVPWGGRHHWTTTHHHHLPSV